MQFEIFLVEDHPIFRAALIPHINGQPNLHVCGQAADVSETLTGIKSASPDLVLVDLQLRRSSGFELMRLIHSRYPKIRMLVLTMYDERHYAARARKFGAAGYVTKYAKPSTVIQAIREVLRGNLFFSEGIMTELSDLGDSGSATDLLNDRELAVFLLLGEGKRTPEIASILNTSEKTVHNYMSAVKRRLRFDSRQELYQRAKEWSVLTKSA